LQPTETPRRHALNRSRTVAGVSGGPHIADGATRLRQFI
jgi:hypothetical protein